MACIVVASLGTWQIFQLANQAEVAVASPTPIPNPTDPTPTHTPPPTLTPTAQAPEQTTGGEAGHASPLQFSTEELLSQAVLPERDQRSLAMRLTQPGVDIPQIVHNTAPLYQVGATDIFWVTDNQQIPPRQFQVNAVLQYATNHVYWWVQEGFSVDEEGLKRSAEQFEEHTYPTNHAFFGSEWSPGVDNDVHVHVFMGNVPGVAGYFSASNEYSRLAEPFSNEREMLYINLQAAQPGNDYFDSLLAHEFQHMIHWHQDRNEDTWVNEGLGELAAYLNQYGISNFTGSYLNNPDTQLTSWADTPNAAAANYGGGFLFMAYFLQRFGETMTQAVVAHPLNGRAGFDAVLADHGYTEQFDDIYADFVVANYLQNPQTGTGNWGYTDFTPGSVTPAVEYVDSPVEKQDTVHQYGADYIEINAQGTTNIEFTGVTQVQVIGNNAHSGNYQWYSHRGDDTNTRLTGIFDLSDVRSATLNYWTWYDIEKDWDYGYVEASTDGGQSWTILETPHTSTENPTGNGYGPGYTGTSAGWIEEKIDLSEFAGQEIMVRFEYITDDAVNRPGWAIDDISIPEINFFDNAENSLNAWQAEGFVRMDNVLPQKFLVQVIEIGNEATVQQISLDENNRGAFTINGMGQTIDRAILIISGLTPVTTEPAGYQYKLSVIE
jgi:hypothetical protein